MKRLSLILATSALFAFPASWASTDLVANGGFETGSFSSWTLSGNTSTDTTYVLNSPISLNGGTFEALFGPVGSLGFLSQTLTTVPGQHYDLSFWLQHVPSGEGTPSRFQLSWDGVVIDDRTDLATFRYTRFAYPGVIATGFSTDLKFGFREDPDYFQIDDVSVSVLASVPEPGMPLLFGSGLALVLAYRARRSLRTRPSGRKTFGTLET